MCFQKIHYFLFAKLEEGHEIDHAANEITLQTIRSSMLYNLTNSLIGALV